MRLSPDNKTLFQVTDNDMDAKGVFHVPNGVTSIDPLAFYNCKRLHQVTIPNSVTSVGSRAFDNCTNLQTITIPNSVTLIDKATFYNCSHLHTVTILSSTISINDWAFENCSALKKVMILGKTNLININAYINCPKLELIIIASSGDIELAHMTELLPDKFKNKIITKDLFDKVARCCETQLSKLIETPQTNRLYRFFNVEAKFISKVELENKEKQQVERDCCKLPNEIFWHINQHLGDNNPYYHKVKTLIEREPWPKTNNEFKSYKKRITEIVDSCINKTIEWAELKLDDTHVNLSL